MVKRDLFVCGFITFSISSKGIFVALTEYAVSSLFPQVTRKVNVHAHPPNELSLVQCGLPASRSQSAALKRVRPIKCEQADRQTDSATL